MKELDEAARPILEPMIRGHDKQALDAESQRLVARWAFLMALLIDQRGSDDLGQVPILHDDIRRDFYALREPPELARVDLAADANVAPWWIRLTGDGLPGSGEPFVVMVTIVILRSHCRSSFSTPFSTRRGDFPNAPTAAVSLRIWPVVNDPIIWPKNGLYIGDKADLEQGTRVVFGVGKMDGGGSFNMLPLNLANNDRLSIGRKSTATMERRSRLTLSG